MRPYTDLFKQAVAIKVARGATISTFADAIGVSEDRVSAWWHDLLGGARIVALDPGTVVEMPGGGTFVVARTAPGVWSLRPYDPFLALENAAPVHLH